MLNRRFHSRTTFTDSNADCIPEVPPPTPALGQFKYPALCISKKTPSFYSIQGKNLCDIISRMNSKTEPTEEECAIIQESHIETNSTVRNVYNTAGYVFPKSGETKMYLWQVPNIGKERFYVFQEILINPVMSLRDQVSLSLSSNFNLS
ncbi:uncharacterized protein LOC107270485 isoform X2 [Cephus cinctus]|nr:uncharacterized protein LOC107270485 isoform X2 [Cephus cinctus]